jgi:hypothetical protein
VSFKPGDAVIIISHPKAIYPADAMPGTVATIIRQCDCPLASLGPYPYWEIKIPTRACCAVEIVLKKIDPEGRQLTRWEDCAWKPALPVSSV